MFKPIAAAAAILLASAAPLAEAALVIDRLDPAGGALTGTPGTLLGWGFKITNESDTDWLQLTASDFSPAPGWWTYTDFIASSDILLGPKVSLTQVFDAAGGTGTGSFLIDALANPGDAITGTIILTYDGYNGDPTQGGADQTLFSETAASPASVTVQAPTSTPEPSSAVLVGLALGLLGYARTRPVSGRIATSG